PSRDKPFAAAASGSVVVSSACAFIHPNLSPLREQGTGSDKPHLPPRPTRSAAGTAKNQRITATRAGIMGRNCSLLATAAFKLGARSKKSPPRSLPPTVRVRGPYTAALLRSTASRKKKSRCGCVFAPQCPIEGVVMVRGQKNGRSRAAIQVLL